jgi:hypothetical protein
MDWMIILLAVIAAGVWLGVLSLRTIINDLGVINENLVWQNRFLKDSH